MMVLQRLPDRIPSCQDISGVIFALSLAKNAVLFASYRLFRAFVLKIPVTADFLLRVRTYAPAVTVPSGLFSPSVPLVPFPVALFPDTRSGLWLMVIRHIRSPSVSSGSVRPVFCGFQQLCRSSSLLPGIFRAGMPDRRSRRVTARSGSKA